MVIIDPHMTISCSLKYWRMCCAFRTIFLVILLCVHEQPCTSFDVQKILHKYVAVCGFDNLCNPKLALLPNLTVVPKAGNNDFYCAPCLCTPDCFG